MCRCHGGKHEFSKNRSEAMDDKTNTESSHSTVLKSDCYNNRTTIRYGSGYCIGSTTYVCSVVIDSNVL